MDKEGGARHCYPAGCWHFAHLLFICQTKYLREPPHCWQLASQQTYCTHTHRLRLRLPSASERYLFSLPLLAPIIFHLLLPILPPVLCPASVFLFAQLWGSPLIVPSFFLSPQFGSLPGTRVRHLTERAAHCRVCPASRNLSFSQKFTPNLCSLNRPRRVLDQQSQHLLEKQK